MAASELPAAPVDESYPQNLYRYHAVAEALSGPDAMEEVHLRQFHERGFLAVEAFFTPEETQDALDGLLALIAAPHPEIQVEYERSAGDSARERPFDQKQDSIRKFMGFVNHEPRLLSLAAHPRLLGVVARLIEAEPELFQDMALIKPPHIGREKPWHQDHAYFDFPLGTPIVGVWVALDEATLANGCMQILPGSHRLGPAIHFQRRDWQLCDTQANPGGESLAVPLKPGGCLFFDGLLHHGTPANRSPHRRRAVQFHYKPAGAEPASQEERLAHFGSEGKNVSC